MRTQIINIQKSATVSAIVIGVLMGMVINIGIVHAYTSGPDDGSRGGDSYGGGTTSSGPASDSYGGGTTSSGPDDGSRGGDSYGGGTTSSGPASDSYGGGTTSSGPADSSSDGSSTGSNGATSGSDGFGERGGEAGFGTSGTGIYDSAPSKKIIEENYARGWDYVCQKEDVDYSRCIWQYDASHVAQDNIIQGEQVKITKKTFVHNTPGYASAFTSVTKGTLGKLIQAPRWYVNNYWAYVAFDKATGWVPEDTFKRNSTTTKKQTDSTQKQTNSSNIQSGDKVKVTERMNVRTVPGLRGSKIDLIRPGTVATVVDGPKYAGDYQWWKLQYNQNDNQGNGKQGWVAGKWLSKLSNLATEDADVKVSIRSISDKENPIVTGYAYNTKTVGVVVSNGDKVYGSGDVAVRNNKWTHKISTDLEDGTYKLLVYVDNTAVASKSFTIETASSDDATDNNDNSNDNNSNNDNSNDNNSNNDNSNDNTNDVVDTSNEVVDLKVHLWKEGESFDQLSRRIVAIKRLRVDYKTENVTDCELKMKYSGDTDVESVEGKGRLIIDRVRAYPVKGIKFITLSCKNNAGETISDGIEIDFWSQKKDYKGYVDGKIKNDRNNITRVNALSRCLRLAEKNVQQAVYCVFGNKVIYQQGDVVIEDNYELDTDADVYTDGQDANQDSGVTDGQSNTSQGNGQVQGVSTTNHQAELAAALITLKNILLSL